MLTYLHDSCCGLTRAEDFNGYDSHLDVPELERLTRTGPNNSARMVTGTINQEQYEDMWEALSEDGWHILADWTNSNSGNQVYLIAFCPNFNLSAETGRTLVTRVRVPAPPPETPPAVWRLSRVRFNDDGLVTERINLEEFDAPPSEARCAVSIRQYKERFRRTPTDRMRFSVERVEV